MKMRACLKPWAVLVLLAGAAPRTGAAMLASDSAADGAYAGGWASSANGGFGFNAWTLATGGGPGGFFTGSSVNNAAGSSPVIDTGGQSWGLWANSGGQAVAFRSFANSLAVGQVLQLSMDNGYIESGSSVGFTIRTGNASGGTEDYNAGARFEFLYIGGDATNSYKVVDAAGVRNVDVPFTGTGLRLAFTLNTSTAYTLQVTDNASDATVTITGALQDAAPLQSLALYNNSAGPEAPHDAFFNSLGVSGEGGPTLAHRTVDAGGQRITGTGVTVDGSIGGIGGAATADEVALTSGYVAQLPDVANVAIVAAPSAVDEGDNVQLAGVAAMDDDSLTPLAASEIAWSASAYPILSISASGLAETMQVYAGTNASVAGLYAGVAGSGVFLVRDANLDNFGIYAADSVPDGWQVQLFGLHNFNGLAHANPDNDPHDNLQEWTALTDPTNPASYFAINAVSNQPLSRIVRFGPTSPARVYRLVHAANPAEAVWTGIPGAEWTAGTPGQSTLCDTNAAATRFYRVEVDVP